MEIYKINKKNPMRTQLMYYIMNKTYDYEEREEEG